jgi:hypothetical protein
MSSPASEQMVPPASLTATIFAPSFARISAAAAPTFPKPWIRTREPAIWNPFSYAHSSMQ